MTNLRHWQKDSKVIKCTDKRCVVSFRDVRAAMSLRVTRVNVHHISLPVSGHFWSSTSLVQSCCDTSLLFTLRDCLRTLTVLKLLRGVTGVADVDCCTGHTAAWCDVCRSHCCMVLRVQVTLLRGVTCAGHTAAWCDMCKSHCCVV